MNAPTQKLNRVKLLKRHRLGAGAGGDGAVVSIEDHHVEEDDGDAAGRRPWPDRKEPVEAEQAPGLGRSMVR